MPSIIGNEIINGIPYINGKPAKRCEDPECCLCKTSEMKDALSEWLCPECGSHLGKDTLICLNGCHLSAASFRRFQQGLIEAYVRVEQRKKENNLPDCE